MFDLFAPLGKWLDKTYIDLRGRQRFSKIHKNLRGGLGALGFSFMCMIVLTLAVIWVWWSATHPPQAHFFLKDAPAYLVRKDAAADHAAATALEGAATTQRQLVDAGGPIRAEIQPSTSVELLTSRSAQMSFERVQSWLTRALMDAYTLDFQNYQSQLESSRILFRPDTYNLFVREMNLTLVSSVVRNRMLLSMTPTSSVRLIQPAEYKGRRLWMLEMHGLLYYDGAFSNRVAPQKVLFIVIVEEVPSSQTPYGLVISSITTQ